MTRIYVLLFVVAMLVACNKKKEEPAPAGSAMAPTPVLVDAEQGSAAGSAQPAGSAAAAVEVPTEVDFEDQAATEITDKNVEARVKALEAELSQ